jgi:hypothetical protein
MKRMGSAEQGPEETALTPSTASTTKKRIHMVPSLAGGCVAALNETDHSGGSWSHPTDIGVALSLEMSGLSLVGQSEG